MAFLIQGNHALNHRLEESGTWRFRWRAGAAQGAVAAFRMAHTVPPLIGDCSTPRKGECFQMAQSGGGSPARSTGAKAGGA